MNFRKVQKEVREGKQLFLDCNGATAIISLYSPKNRQCVITDNPEDFYLYELNNYDKKRT